jgi:hypothetical protein
MSTTVTIIDRTRLGAVVRCPGCGQPFFVDRSQATRELGRTCPHCNSVRVRLRETVHAETVEPGTAG